MRLLNVRTRQLEEFTGTVPSYAILSHTWTSGEVSFQDLTQAVAGLGRKDEKKKPGWQKIDGLCTRAALDGYRYAWIDTCCIDKSSSAELSEAINSMYAVRNFKALHSFFSLSIAAWASRNIYQM